MEGSSALLRFLIRKIFKLRLDVGLGEIVDAYLNGSVSNFVKNRRSKPNLMKDPSKNHLAATETKKY